MMYKATVCALLIACASATLRGYVPEQVGVRRVVTNVTVHEANDCGNGKAAATFSSIALTPDPPVPGSPAKLTASGTVNEVVSGGVGTTVVSLDGAQIFSAPINTCGQSQVTLPLGLGTVDITALTCPTTSGGPATLSVVITVPSIAPSGSYDVVMQGNDQSGNLAFCAEAKFSL